MGNSTVQPNFYLYDGDDPICELDGSDGSFKRVNTWGANGLVSRITKASSTGYYTYDPQGNLCQLLNGGAGVSVTYHTDAFGNVTSSNGSGATFAFGAQWGYSADSETGFVLCGHRFYDPTNGRWITRDPISYNGGMNLYGYCKNNSVNMKDPSGHAEMIIVQSAASWGIPTHVYLKVNCGNSEYGGNSYGFYPGTDPILGIGVIENPDKNYGKGHVMKRNDDICFNIMICKCIADSMATPQVYSIIPWNTCNSWADFIWQCAERRCATACHKLGPGY